MQQFNRKTDFYNAYANMRIQRPTLRDRLRGVWHVAWNCFGALGIAVAIVGGFIAFGGGL